MGKHQEKSIYLFMWAIVLRGMYESSLLLPKLIDKLVSEIDIVERNSFQRVRL